MGWMKFMSGMGAMGAMDGRGAGLISATGGILEGMPKRDET